MDQSKGDENTKDPKGAEDNNSNPSTSTQTKKNTTIPPGAQEKSDNKQKINWPVWIQAICTIIIVFITGFYTHYAGKQAVYMKNSVDIATATLNTSGITVNKTLAEMRTQSEAMQKSAEASKKNAEVSARGVAVSRFGIKTIERQTRLDQRAWIGITKVLCVMESGKPLSVEIDFKNTGKSPAIKFRQKIVVEFKQKNVSPDFSNENIATSYAGACIAPQAEFNIQSPPAIPDAGFIINSIAKGDVIFFVHGIVHYDDIFKRHHWVTYCHYFDPDINNFRSYYEHNDTDGTDNN